MNKEKLWNGLGKVPESSNYITKLTNWKPGFYSFLSISLIAILLLSSLALSATQLTHRNTLSTNLLTNNPYALPPQILNTTVHPTDVQPGDLMTITAQIQDSPGITRATAEMPTKR